MKSNGTSSFGLFFAHCDVGVNRGTFQGHLQIFEKRKDRLHRGCKRTFEGTESMDTPSKNPLGCRLTGNRG